MKKLSSPLPYGYKINDDTNADGGFLEGPENRTPWVCVTKHLDGEGWCIRSNSDDRIPRSIRSISFPTKEHAAAVGLATCLNHDRLMKDYVAPQPLVTAIMLAEREIDSMEKAARDMAFAVALAKINVDKLRTAAGLPANEWRKDDLVEALNTFTLCCSTKQKYMKQPFFTQAVLYDMLGKEDARSVLGLINQIKRRLDPVGGAL